MGNAAENIIPIHESIEIPPMEDGVATSAQTISEPMIFGLTSACGGSGVTSIALQMAFHAAGSLESGTDMPAQRVALLSLDFENSAIAHYLAVAPKISAEHFCQSPNVMNQQNCLGWMSETGKGFDVLALPNSIDGNSRVNPNSVLHFLDLVAQAYDVIILDIPRIWMRWTHAAMGAADKIAFVTELNIPALHLTRERYAALVKSVPALSKAEILLNKYEKRAMRNSLSLSDAQKIFRNIPMSTLSAKPDHIRESINRGEPMGQLHKSLKTVRQINAFYEDWLTACQEEKIYGELPA